MAALIDTNILVYRFDPRYPAKQARATALLKVYAERFGLDTIFSEDFAHDRRYGRVRTIDPFR